MKLGNLLKGWVGGLFAALAVVFVGILGWWLLAPRPADQTSPPVVTEIGASGGAAVEETAAPESPPITSEPPQAQVETPDMPAETPTAAEEAPPGDATAVSEEPGDDTETAAVAQPGEPAPLAPSFDVVRIRPEGDALVAGRAEAGARVIVRVEGETVAETRADAGEGFVAMFSLPPAEADRVMTLEAELADGTRLASETSVIIEGVDLPDIVALAEPEPEPAPRATLAPAAPEAAPEATEADEAGAVAEAEAPEAATPTSPEAVVDAGETAPSVGDELPEAAAEPDVGQPDTATDADAGAEAAGEAPAAAEPTAEPPAASETPAASEPDAVETPGEAPAETPAPPEPDTQAPRVLLAGPDGVRVLQEPGPNPQLSIDAISYEAGGDVALSGRGQGARTLRIYLDNAPVGLVEVDPAGQWRAPLPDLAAGVYTLRVDSLAPDGSVENRVETPFMREDPQVLAAAETQAAAGGQAVSAITVQPGHTLWAIAEGRYGEGIAYWAIFDANRDQIRDPHWIYPGQVFTLPDTAE